MVLITPRSVTSVGRLDALAVDTNFAKKAEGWVSSRGDVTFWLELMAPKRQGLDFDPHTPIVHFFLLFFLLFLFKSGIQKKCFTCGKKKFSFQANKFIYYRDLLLLFSFFINDQANKFIYYRDLLLLFSLFIND